MSDGTPAGPLRAIAESLIRGGVRDVVVCPGSRSTPLALAIRAHPGLRTFVQLDERAGGFFALGAARGARRPAAILTTSGTASVNLAPAVTEARYGRVPLLALTADRPPELQGIGAPQTIDQVELFGSHAKWYAALPVPDGSPEAEAEARSVLGRALDVAVSPPAGPVHVDLPFREPLLPDGPLAPEGSGSADAPEPASGRPVPALAPRELERLVAALRASARPLIVCGPLDRLGFAAAVSRFASTARAPLIADVLSNVRTGPHDRMPVVAHHDALLRSKVFRDGHRPDLVIRFGATPTSKVLVSALGEVDAPQLLVDDGHGFERPRGPGLARVDADPVAFAQAAAEAAGESSADPGWLAAWRMADDAAARAIATWLEALAEPFEGAVARALVAGAPEGAVVVAGNSMPVRDLDAFLPTSPRSLRVLGNRGANGIDGQLSTALGASVAQDAPVMAVVGDLGLLHDLGALAGAARLGLDATIVLVDNDGGGIFSFLPQAVADRPELGLPAHYEELFGTPHGLDLGPVVTALGARYQPVDHDSLAPALAAAAGQRGIDVLGLRTDRVRNRELHQAVTAAVVRALEEDT